MTTWIALLRGINVGGNNILPMAALKQDFESLKCTNVSTYIQSGNIVFNSTSKSARKLSERIARRIEEKHGFRPHVFILNLKNLQDAVAANPFPKAVSDPKSLHFSFLEESPVAPNLEALEKAKSPTETYELTDRVFYLHAPDGIGRSKLAANVEKHLGVVTTGRNYRTVDKLLSMAAQAES